jgi:short-subunit dehydrogenase
LALGKDSDHICSMKNAIVTGSTKGMGRSIAERLSSEGYRVWISARNQNELETAKREIEMKSGNEVMIHAIDFSNRALIERYADEILKSGESIDVLVNNVGVYIPDNLKDAQQKLDMQMDVNFYAPYYLTQKLLQKFEAQQAGSIFNICSVVNRKPRVDGASYTISKFAFWGYHKLLHQTLLPLGIKVTGFFPSSINTSSWDGMEAPKDEFVQPEDVAEMIATILTMKRGTVPSEIDLVAIHPEF